MPRLRHAATKRYATTAHASDAVPHRRSTVGPQPLPTQQQHSCCTLSLRAGQGLCLPEQLADASVRTWSASDAGGHEGAGHAVAAQMCHRRCQWYSFMSPADTQQRAAFAATALCRSSVGLLFAVLTAVLTTWKMLSRNSTDRLQGLRHLEVATTANTCVAMRKFASLAPLASIWARRVRESRA